MLNGTNRVEGFNSGLEKLFGDLRTPLDEMPSVIGQQNEKLKQRVSRTCAEGLVQAPFQLRPTRDAILLRAFPRKGVRTL